MQFDDRLATVLRTPALGDAAARTQYRQLLDLLGSLPDDIESPLIDASYVRLAELGELIPAVEQSRILRAPDLRLRSRTLAARLAHSEPQAAAAAMATAQLSERDWLYLIPRLPVTARGFLRHRRDLPASAVQVLERLGVRDLVLPEPAAERSAPSAPRVEFSPRQETAPLPKAIVEPAPEAGIAALVRRIEAFQQARRNGTSPPPPPAAIRHEPLDSCDFATDAAGVVTWAETGAAPALVGLDLCAQAPSALAQLDTGSLDALRLRLPIRAGRLELQGPAIIAGTWQVDATPLFALAGGHYEGHAGKLRRVPQPAAAVPMADNANDRMRQVLHELRTPVNAIQGFAEIIQQQLFGAAPHEYRALAAAIAVDAARLMAGFDELDRLAKLESGALELTAGSSDLHDVIGQLLRRLEGVLRPRGARMLLVGPPSPAVVALGNEDAGGLAWRILATLVGAMSPGEVVELNLTTAVGQVTLRAELPSALAEVSDLFAASTPGQARAVSAGMFGTGFALRLARAEAIASGGSLVREGDLLALTLPALTAPDALHTLSAEG